MLSSANSYGDDLLEDIETVKVIDELRSALCSLDGVCIERVQVLSELRGEIGKQRLLSPANCGTADGLRIEPRVVELLVDYRADMSWAGKTDEWKEKAMLVIMISCRKELLKQYHKIAICPNADTQPFLDIEVADIACSQNIRRRVCARAFYQTPYKHRPSWIINGRWMPDPESRVPPGTWDPTKSSFETYLNEVLDNQRLILRRNHYILSLNKEFEIWRTRCPSLADALKLFTAWAYDNYLLPLPKEWLMFILICALIYQEKALGFDGTNVIPINRIADGPSDRSKGKGYGGYSSLSDLAPEELFARCLKTLAQLSLTKPLLLPLSDDQFTPHDPSKPLVDFEPNNYFDYSFVVARCWNSKTAICASYPTWYFASSFDPRGLLIDCPNDSAIERSIAIAKASISSELSIPSRVAILSPSDILAIVCAKTPRALTSCKISKELAKYKNIVNNHSTWKNVIPSDMDETTVLSESINLRLKNLRHVIHHQFKSDLIYKATLPYPLVLLITKSKASSFGHSTEEILAACGEVLGEDFIDQFCSTKSSIEEILPLA